MGGLEFQPFFVLFWEERVKCGVGGDWLYWFEEKRGEREVLVSHKD